MESYKPHPHLPAYITAALLAICAGTALADDRSPVERFGDWWGSLLRGKHRTHAPAKKDDAKPNQKQHSTSGSPAKKPGDCTDTSPGIIDYVISETNDCEDLFESKNHHAAHCTGNIGDIDAYQDRMLTIRAAGHVRGTNDPLDDILINVRVLDYVYLSINGIAAIPPLSPGTYPVAIEGIEGGKRFAEVEGDIVVHRCEPLAAAPAKPDTVIIERYFESRKESRERICTKGIHEKGIQEHISRASPGTEAIFAAAIADLYGPRNADLSVNGPRVLTADKDLAGGIGKNFAVHAGVRTKNAAGDLIYRQSRIEGDDRVIGHIYDAMAEERAIRFGFMRYSGPGPVRFVAGGDIEHIDRATEQEGGMSRRITTRTLGGDLLAGVGIGQPNGSYAFGMVGLAGESETGNGNRQTRNGIMAAVGGGVAYDRLVLEGRLSHKWLRDSGEGFDSGDDMLELQGNARLPLHHRFGLIATGKIYNDKGYTNGAQGGVTKSNGTGRQAGAGVYANF